MSKRPSISWKTITDQRRKENFVGRDEQIRVFQENFDEEIPKYMVFSVTGEGGVGKSTLLKRFEQKANDIAANVVICDDRQISPVEVMGSVAEQLSRIDIKHNGFDERNKKYRELRQQIESDPNAPPSILNAVGHGIADLTLMGLSIVPGVAPLVNRVDAHVAGNVVADLIQYTATRWTNKDEVMLIREPERVLTPLFVDLLDKASEEQRLILMLDVFERTGKLLSPWLLALFNSEYGELSPWLTFVISGRDVLEQHWTEQAGNICHMRLEPFTEDETRIYMSYKGITDENLVQQIYKDTGGLPVLIELLSATNPKPGLPLPDISKDAVDRFLLWTPEEMQQVALLASIPRQFNQDVLSVLLGEKAHLMFRWLSEQSYIRSNTERGWFYHEKVRELMMRYQGKLSPAELEDSHLALSQYFAMLQGELQIPVYDVYQNKVWRSYEIERVYHLFSASPEKYWSQVVEAFLSALHYRWRFAMRLVRLMQQAVDEIKHSSNEQRIVIISNLVAAYEKDNYSEIILYLDILHKWIEQKTNALFAFFACKCMAYFMMGEYDEALKAANNAIELNEKATEVVSLRGGTYFLMRKHDEALKDFNSAIDFGNKSAWVIAFRGETYRKMGKYGEAVNDFDNAIRLDEKFAWAITNRGEIYSDMGKYDQALEDFNRSIFLDEKSIWAIGDRGYTYCRMGKYDDALKDFNCIIDWDEKSTWGLAHRGETYRKMGKYDEALNDFNNAIALDEKYVWGLANRGETYRKMNRYHEALKDFDQAIQLSQGYHWAYEKKGQVLVSLGQLDDALDAFTNAHDLDRTCFNCLACRGMAYYDLGDYEKALKDFDYLIELGDKSVWVFRRRADVYLSMRNYSYALLDLDRIISLDDKDSETFFTRGEILRRLGRFSDALDDFNGIFFLRGDRIDIHHLARRALTFKSMGNYELAKVDLAKALSMPCNDTRDHYNRAAALLVNDQLAEALVEFDLAFVDRAPRDYAVTDDLLDTIRDLPEYKAMLARHDQ